MENVDVCTICTRPLHDNSGDVRTVKIKGLQTMISRSRDLNDDKWHAWEGITSVNVHERCRKQYTANKIPSAGRQSNPQDNVQPSLSSANRPSTKDNSFDFGNLCFVCGKNLGIIRKQISCITMPHVLQRMLEFLSDKEEEYADLIERLKYLIDSANVKASYHRRCYSILFCSGTQKATSASTLRNAEIFEEICHYIENSKQHKFTFDDLKKFMGETPMDTRSLISKFKKKYNQDIYISQHTGKQPIFYYKMYVIAEICNEWLMNGTLGDIKKKTILSVAAEILREDIQNAEFQVDSYPPSSLFLKDTTSVIPGLLRNFLRDLLIKDNNVEEDNFIKRDNIAHTIIAMIRPRSFLSTLQLAVATYVHRKTGSRLIIDLLSKLGVSATYHNMQLYEASTILNPPKTVRRHFCPICLGQHRSQRQHDRWSQHISLSRRYCRVHAKLVNKLQRWL